MSDIAKICGICVDEAFTDPIYLSNPSSGRYRAPFADRFQPVSLAIKQGYIKPSQQFVYHPKMAGMRYIAIMMLPLSDSFLLH